MMEDAKKIDNSCSEVSQTQTKRRIETDPAKSKVSDAELAEISGGPHFRTWHVNWYDY